MLVIGYLHSMTCGDTQSPESCQRRQDGSQGPAGGTGQLWLRLAASRGTITSHPCEAKLPSYRPGCFVGSTHKGSYLGVS